MFTTPHTAACGSGVEGQSDSEREWEGGEGGFVAARCDTEVGLGGSEAESQAWQEAHFSEVDPHFSEVDLQFLAGLPPQVSLEFAQACPALPAAELLRHALAAGWWS